MNESPYNTPATTTSGESEALTAREIEALADTMFALSTASRIGIVALLRAGPRPVGEIVAEIGMEQSAISHQLRVLREHGVLSVERRGRERYYGLRSAHVASLLDEALHHVRINAEAETREHIDPSEEETREHTILTAPTNDAPPARRRD